MPTAAPRLRLYIDGTDSTIEEIRAIGVRARNARPVLEQIQALMAEGAAEQFVSEGARGGLKWKPDERSYVERKAKEGHATDLEVRTHTLHDSLVAKGGGGNAIRRLSKASTTFGTRVYYAQFQGHRRELLAVTKTDQDRWATKMIDYILTGEL